MHAYLIDDGTFNDINRFFYVDCDIYRNMVFTVFI